MKRSLGRLDFGGSHVRNVFYTRPTRVPQECPITVSSRGLQECPTRERSIKEPDKSVPQTCPTGVADKSVRQEWPARVSYKSAPQECPTSRVSYKSAPQECPTRECQTLFGRLFSSIYALAFGFVGFISCFA